eukprot:CAMPEP_0185793728 /NCGR_PEP_ID=MMETSP1174-20130828/159630_1 /TAXON_ID=35687 /ORGANISM="Dictyocha speculum, Strain CCMP1381" /LENGTH=42 /DNA_ID= /DNA_START= /DNA_END= /DNA_ORIENTATION=
MAPSQADEYEQLVAVSAVSSDSSSAGEKCSPPPSFAADAAGE